MADKKLTDGAPKMMTAGVLHTIFQLSLPHRFPAFSGTDKSVSG
jgi:hypothetical protein